MYHFSPTFPFRMVKSEFGSNALRSDEQPKARHLERS